ncbi:MAG TPA: antibiotic biosynthesis monooxygenase family protein [Pseudonocardiaceae bacterium]|nr:antibiotic biosynthesis monooxygenase family protein [Pseudonocardiaceae bacterium]
MPVPPFDAVGDRAVTFVNRFAVHGSCGQFEQAFTATSAFMGRQPGFLGHMLLRHADEGNEHHYLNIAWWRDTASFRVAIGHPDFTPHTAALRVLSTSEPNLYLTRQLRTAPEPTTWSASSKRAR